MTKMPIIVEAPDISTLNVPTYGMLLRSNMHYLSTPPAARSTLCEASMFLRLDVVGLTSKSTSVGGLELDAQFIVVSRVQIC